MTHRLEKSLPTWLSLLKVVEEGSINRAAAALHITQPALTRTIARLEDVIGVPLLDRNARGVSLTPYGAALVAHARTIAGEVQAATEEIDALKGNRSGLVRLGATPVILALFVPAALETLRRHQPSIAVRVAEAARDTLLVQLRRGELDLVVSTIPTEDTVDDLALERLLTFTLAIVARTGHPIFNHAIIGFAELARCAWILPPADLGFHQDFTRAFGRAGVRFPGTSVETGSPHAALDLVISSDLLAVVPRRVIGRKYGNDRLREIDIAWNLRERSVGTYTRRGVKSNSAADNLLAAFRRIESVDSAK